MKRIILLISALIPLWAAAQTTFNKPWDDPGKPLLIDVYKDNTYRISRLTADKRIKGIIHKMSEEDAAAYYERRAEATAAGLLFGSYWLPKYDTGGVAQADAYLKMVGDSFVHKELLALDFEMHKKTKQFISPYNASLFAERIYEKTGRYPYIYCGLNNLSRLTASPYRETFRKCKLWIIALTKDGNVAKVFKKHTLWPTYTLWQFGCEINCCRDKPDRPCFYRIKGLECGIDYDIYNGTTEELMAHWAD
ncbi:GH25 family lysozyme [Chitinophaga solisilvae]|uniref:GH25 family lysozyme n=1 Tax=Chitinophaga solisilvae TaxID=1233460 RepID=UPI00136BFFF1|nr:GH25 family lysozyme [Chitinophaga solisilvae]